MHHQLLVYRYTLRYGALEVLVRLHLIRNLTRNHSFEYDETRESQVQVGHIVTIQTAVMKKAKAKEAQEIMALLVATDKV